MVYPHTTSRCLLTRIEEVILAEVPEHDPQEETNQFDLQLPLQRIEPKGFSYLTPLARFKEEKPFHTQLPFLKGFARTNIAEQAYPVTVTDVTGHEDHFKLDTTGFEYVKMPVPITDWTQEVGQTVYLPLIEKWLMAKLHCRKVYIYTCTVRELLRSTLSGGRTDLEISKFRSKDAPESNIQWTTPFTRVHCGE